MTGTLLAEPIVTSRNRMGQGPARERRMPMRNDSRSQPFTATTFDPLIPDHPISSSQFPAEKRPGRRARGICGDDD